MPTGWSCTQGCLRVVTGYLITIVTVCHERLSWHLEPDLKAREPTDWLDVFG